MNTAQQAILARLATSYSAVATAEAEETPTPESAHWSGVIVMEGEPTGDGRLIEKGALRWEVSEDDPILIRYVRSDVGAHDGAEVVGHIFSIERRDNGEVFARGDFDMGSEIGREAYRQVNEKLTRGVSVDLDDVSFEIRVAGDVLEENRLIMEQIDNGEEPEEPEDEVDEEGRVTVHKMNADDELFVTTEARIRAATLVATPAFSGALISVDEGDSQTASGASKSAPLLTSTGDIHADKLKSLTYPEAPTKKDSLIAAAAPVAPPAAWFDDPQLSGPTGLHVDDNGRVYGHAATWDSCHIAEPGGKGICTSPPRSATDYAYFHTGAVRTEEGHDVATGRLTMATGHAATNANYATAAAHYDHTGTAIADVRSGEDAYGIWVAGALRPKVTADQVREFRGSPLSGDWRKVGSNLEMVAALSVNVPGFPIPRPKGLVASGETVSLVAAGMVAPEEDAPETGPLSDSDVKYLKKLADSQRAHEKHSLVERVGKIKTQMNRRKVSDFAAKRKKETV